MKVPVANVLVVEDDPHMREVLAVLLADEQTLLSSARSAAEALACVGSKHIDLILLDLGLPGMNGFELLKQLKNQPETSMIPVIVLTAWNSTGDKLRGFELGASDYLTKPFEAAELRARVCAALRAKHLQDELTRANRELLSARLAAEAAARAKADFLAHMSHEIRTPMNGIISMASLVLETTLNNEQRGYVETIYTSSESLLTIINDILDFSKIESGKLELEAAPFHLRTCLEETLDLLAPKAAEKGIEIASDIEDELPAEFLGDITRLKQVLVNLLSNGVKFTAQGEVIIVVKVLAAPGQHAGPTEPWHLHFSVRDTGIGIPVDRLARLFKSFSQADASTTRKYGGTGLGLAISKSLVEKMGGKMWVESIPQRGSTFHFTVPLRASEKAKAAPVPTPPPFPGARVLVVAGPQSVRDLLLRQVQKWGMLPTAVDTGAEALEMLRSGKVFDLGLLDFSLADTEARALAIQLKSLPSASQLPLVLLTPLGRQKEEREYAAELFADCLTKPLKPAVMAELFARVLSGRKATPARVTAVAPAAPALAERLPLRMLLCDDNVLNQKVALRLLQQMGYRADVAGNGYEALSAIDREHYDLVFMDVMMPEMGGLEATQIIRERQKQTDRHATYAAPIIIIAMTASAMAGDRDKCLNAGMDDYIPKPVRPKELREIVQRWGETLQQMKAQPPAANPESASAEANVEVSNTEDSPVDMTRLLDLTDGTREGLQELMNLFFSQTTTQLGQLTAAVKASEAAEIRRISHSCAGASATCGMRTLAPLLREMENAAINADVSTAPQLLSQAEHEFAKIKVFLEPHLKGAQALTAST